MQLYSREFIYYIKALVMSNCVSTNSERNNVGESLERSSLIDTFFVSDRKLLFHRKVRMLRRKLSKATRGRHAGTLGLPDRGVKGNFRDCFSRFLRYRLDIPTQWRHTYISRSRGYNRRKSRMRTDASSFCSLFCTDG